MKRLILLLLCAALLLTGCVSGVEAKNLRGEWAYIHDTETVILKLTAGGKAVFHEKDYTYTCDAEFITLTSGEEELCLRYKLENEQLYLYEQTEYVYEGGMPNDGLVGKWSDKDDNWSFEFTDTGTFREDGYFPGSYSVNEAEGTFKLMYNDPFEDATCYYTIDGNKLLVEYPWVLVPM